MGDVVDLSSRRRPKTQDEMMLEYWRFSARLAEQQMRLHRPLTLREVVVGSVLSIALCIAVFALLHWLPA